MANKKIFGLVLSLSVAMGSFAVPVGDSGLDISGSFQTGIMMDGAKAKNGDELGQSAQAYFRDDDMSSHNAMRADLNFAYANDASQGVFVKLRAEPSISSPSYGVGIDAAYGWTNVLTPLLKLTVGKNIDASWSTWSVSDANWNDNGLEYDRLARLEAKLLDGKLSIGAAFFTLGLLGQKEILPIDHLKFTTVGVGYYDTTFKAAISATFNAVAGGKYDDGTGTKTALWDYTSGYNNGAEGGGVGFKDHSYFQMLGGLTFTGVDNLTLCFDFDFASSANKIVPQGQTDAETYKSSYFNAALWGKYNMGDLNVSGAVAAETASQDTGTKINSGNLLIRLQPGYKFTDNVSAYLRFQYKIDNMFVNDDYKKAKDGDSGNYKGGGTFTVRPCVTLDLKNGVKFYTYWQHDIITAEKTSAADPKVTNKDSVQLQFLYSF